jgi:hypothetical protein
LEAVQRPVDHKRDGNRVGNFVIHQSSPSPGHRPDGKSKCTQGTKCARDITAPPPDAYVGPSAGRSGRWTRYCLLIVPNYPRAAAPSLDKATVQAADNARSAIRPCLVN